MLNVNLFVSGSTLYVSGSSQGRMNVDVPATVPQLTGSLQQTQFGTPFITVTSGSVAGLLGLTITIATGSNGTITIALS
jgi:hypothetical protein